MAQTIADLAPGGAVQDDDLLILYRDNVSYSFYGSIINSALTNPMTTLGDLITGGASGAPTRLAGNLTATSKYLKSLGTGSAAQAESWAQIQYSEIANTFIDTTWTPADNSGAALSLTINYATYSRVSNIIRFTASITYPSTADTDNAIIGGLPQPTNRVEIILGMVSNILVIPQVSGTTLILYDAQGNALENAQLSNHTLLISGTYQI